MIEKVKFYKCPICGNIIEIIDGDINHVKCCGQGMILLVANTNDAATEKHVPVIEKIADEIIVKVGDVEHPMEDDHYIMWIAQVTNDRVIRVNLNPGDKPEAKFTYIPDSIVYEYCNKHGLWKNKVK